MNSTSTIGLFVFLAAALVSRVVSENALRTLTPEQKVSILDVFSSLRAYSLVPVILLVALIFGLPTFVPNLSGWSAWIGLGGSLLLRLNLQVQHFDVKVLRWTNSTGI